MAKRIRTAVDDAMDDVSQTMNLGKILLGKVIKEWDAWAARGYITVIPTVPLIGEIPIKIPFARETSAEGTEPAPIDRSKAFGGVLAFLRMALAEKLPDAVAEAEGGG